MEGMRDIYQEMVDEKNTRLDSWNKSKKDINSRRKRVNRTKNGDIGFSIRSWSMWWFSSGENIGDEHGSHIDEEEGTVSFDRPCVVISQPKMLKESGYNKVTILPITSFKGQKERPSYVGIKSSDYAKGKMSVGLKKDSYIICSEPRTIDIKRFTDKIAEQLSDDDRQKVKDKLKEYIEF